MRRGAAAAALLALLAGAAAAEPFGPDGFVPPVIGGFDLYRPGTEWEARALAWFELAPEVCAGGSARVHAVVAGVPLALPCGAFVLALLPPDAAPAGTGLPGAPVAAAALAAILARDPDAMVTLAAARDPHGLARRTDRALASGHCAPLGAWLRCPQRDWKPARLLVLAADPALRAAAGHRLALVCEESGGRTHCGLPDGPLEGLALEIHAAAEGLDPALLDRFIRWRLEARAAVRAWMGR